MLRKVYWAYDHRADWRFSRGDPELGGDRKLALRLMSLGVFITSTWPHCFPLWLKLFQRSLHPVRRIAERGWKWREWSEQSCGWSSSCRGRRDRKRKCRAEGASSTTSWAPPGHSFAICWEMLSLSCWLSLLYRTFPGAQAGGCARRQWILQPEFSPVPDSLVSSKASLKEHHSLPQFGSPHNLLGKSKQ